MISLVMRPCGCGSCAEKTNDVAAFKLLGMGYKPPFFMLQAQESLVGQPSKQAGKQASITVIDNRRGPCVSLWDPPLGPSTRVYVVHMGVIIQFYKGCLLGPPIDYLVSILSA